MIGIELEHFESIMDKNSFYYDSIVPFLKIIKKNMSNYKYLYDGEDFEFLFSDILEEVDNIDVISKELEKYLEIMSNVKKAYIKQNELFSYQLDHLLKKWEG